MANNPLNMEAQALFGRLLGGAPASAFTDAERRAMVGAWVDGMRRREVRGVALAAGGLAGIGADALLGWPAGRCVAAGAAAFVIVTLAGYAGLRWAVRRLGADAALDRARAWAAKLRAPGAGSGGRVAAAAAAVLLGVTFLFALVTVPDRARHEAEVRNAVSERIARAAPGNAGGTVMRVALRAINERAKTSPVVSYIDVLGLRYERYWVVSVLRNDRGEVVSVGAFNQVYGPQAGD